MSAAESAHPGPGPHVLAPVLPIHAVRPRSPESSERTPVPAESQPGPPLTDHQRLAAALEAAYSSRHRSLTDESTATDFLIALAEFRKLVRGALETGLLNPEQHEELDGMLEAMEGAPGLLVS